VSLANTLIIMVYLLVTSVIDTQLFEGFFGHYNRKLTYRSDLQIIVSNRPYEMGFSQYIGPGPGEQECALESLKAPVALAIDVLFRFFHFLGDIFNYF